MYIYTYLRMQLYLIQDIKEKNEYTLKENEDFKIVDKEIVKEEKEEGKLMKSGKNSQDKSKSANKKAGKEKLREEKRDLLESEITEIFEEEEEEQEQSSHIPVSSRWTSPNNNRSGRFCLFSIKNISVLGFK